MADTGLADGIIGWAKELLAIDGLCGRRAEFRNTSLEAVGPSTAGASIGLVREKRVLPLIPLVAIGAEEVVVAPNEIAGVVDAMAGAEGEENWIKY